MFPYMHDCKVHCVLYVPGKHCHVTMGATAHRPRAGPYEMRVSFSAPAQFVYRAVIKLVTMVTDTAHLEFGLPGGELWFRRVRAQQRTPSCRRRVISVGEPRVRWHPLRHNYLS